MYYLQIVGLSHTLHALSHMKTDKRTHNMHFHAHINAQKSANTLLHLLAHKHTIGSPKKKKTYSHGGMGSYRIVNQTKCVRFTYRWIHTMCPCIKLHLMFFFFIILFLSCIFHSPTLQLTNSFFLLLSAFFKSTNANTHSTIFKCHEYHCLYKWIYTYIVQMLQLAASESKNTTFGIHIWNIGPFITHIISYLCNVCTFARHS